MANDSSTGGFIPPAASPAPSVDAALDALFQQLVVGVTGLPGTMVRPRWQPVVPKQPDPATDWCAIGVTKFDPDDYPAEVHDGTGDGSSTQSDHESIEVVASFYGPDAMANAKQLRSGLYVAQNRDTLVAAGLNLQEAKRFVQVPELVNQQWIRRWDLTIVFRRQSIYTYPILNIVSPGPLDIESAV
ncbi:phage neck terminator protein [Dyella mobilis]|uniref:Phage neck terminator protein gp12-like domain-containing protein n=1 Tax=Dyella mobilis TaxID=1849582 RepID=A0ABS2KKK8_9GAMM|nr:hypothetical protein [Dyella mobilis]MBM7131555.1 hypothetical protein [Dyella mobilis]GLQ96474.1 bacteriophage protein [Dyella mobilis]